ncbi:PREDICTED: serpin B9-like isoform X3 [Chinchilla lanigera]|uniref:serpin B9-like isoform X3 n=1 Tax=Chinchilla lanigera TaxID=34839 RepID=UPI00038F0669|nr:PREDICTED: serpin B9-like isoform X3 [Chinchilla lanigera]
MGPGGAQRTTGAGKGAVFSPGVEQWCAGTYADLHGDFIMNTLSEANGAFAIRLLKLLGQEDPARNVFYSPLSVSSALAMLLLGAKGRTAAQIVQALAFNTEDDIHRGFQSLLTQVHRPGAPFSLSIANRLFGEESCKILSSFQESCLQFYQAELEQLSFTKDAERSREHINAWVSSKTKGKIEELLAKDSIGEDCRLVLINAVYFKGSWEEPFEEWSTRTVPFKINQKEQRPVQMMFQEATFPLAHVSEVQAQVLELPYKGQELSMVLVLPDEGVDLSTVEKSLTFEKFQSWTRPEHMRRTEVQVCLPRFKLEENYHMESVLCGLGVVDVFYSATVDLSGMLADNNLCVSKFVHKSVVEVNEAGTEAAAASQCELSFDCARILPAFCADHPFLFFIRHNRTGCLLFCGRFSSP